MNAPTTASLAYLLTIAIWSTTPLGIKLSNDSLTPMSAAAARIAIAALVAYALGMLVSRGRLLRRQHFRTYAAAAVGLFPTMPLVYFAALYMPSGLISVFFATAPFFTGVIAWLVFREQTFNRRQILAMLIALSGLVVVFVDQIRVHTEIVWGLLAMFFSNSCFALSGILLKRCKAPENPFELGTGAMLLALPGFLLGWWLLDGRVPETISTQSGFWVLYLAIIGSVLGFMTYFYVLRTVSLAAVAIMPLISPLSALWLGHWLANETLTAQLLFGTCTIITALALFEGTLFRYVRRPGS